MAEKLMVGSRILPGGAGNLRLRVQILRLRMSPPKYAVMPINLAINPSIFPIKKKNSYIKNWFNLVL